MKCITGIDLGSTTTKAVVMDEDQHILGRGITNSRSNYDLAAQIAREEAFTTARFGLMEREVERSAGKEAMHRVLRAFRLSQFLVQLEHLEAFIREEADAGMEASMASDAGRVLTIIFDGIRREEEALYESDTQTARSEFFRDIAGSGYMRGAELAVKGSSLQFDQLAGLYDKCIIKVENKPLELGFREHIGTALERVGNSAAAQKGVDVALKTHLEEVSSVGTGYGRARLPFPKEQIRSEILCHGLGAHFLYPATRTVLDIGGQDTKAIQVDENGYVTGFQMNDRCAAGCGRYLGYIADEMNIGVHELGPLADQATHRTKINSTCTVFAGAELRERLSLGEKREDIVAGLHRAIILRAMSLLARSGGVSDEFTFTGGVAHNSAARRALMDLVKENYGERTLNISADSIFTGALGAALFALREAA